MATLPDRKLAQLVLPRVKESKDFVRVVRELLLESLLQDSVNGPTMPSTITKADLADVEGLIRKLEVIASEG